LGASEGKEKINSIGELLNSMKNFVLVENMKTGLRLPEMPILPLAYASGSCEPYFSDKDNFVTG
jgi:hypothetical protein